MFELSQCRGRVSLPRCLQTRRWSKIGSEADLTGLTLYFETCLSALVAGSQGSCYLFLDWILIWRPISPLSPLGILGRNPHTDGYRTGQNTVILFYQELEGGLIAQGWSLGFSPMHGGTSAVWVLMDLGRGPQNQTARLLALLALYWDLPYIWNNTIPSPGTVFIISTYDPCW